MEPQGIEQIQSIGQQFYQSFLVWRDTLIRNIPGIVLAIIVLLVALILDDRVQRWVERIVGIRERHRELARLLGRMARWSVIIVALLVIVSIFKLTQVVTAFVASLGIVGLVIAFALQDITKNFAAGVLLLIQRPFRLDDRIKVKDFEGIVIDVSLRATALRTADGEEVLVPNADVYTSPITNYTRYPRRRYHVALPVPATLPVDQVRQQLEAALRSLPDVQSDPAPGVTITSVTNDSVTLDATYWLPSHVSNVPHIHTQVIARLHEIIAEQKREAAQAVA